LVQMLCASGTKPGANNLNFRPIGKFPRGASNILPAGAAQPSVPAALCLMLDTQLCKAGTVKSGNLSGGKVGIHSSNSRKKVWMGGEYPAGPKSSSQVSRRCAAPAALPVLSLLGLSSVQGGGAFCRNHRQAP
jgi:hypothetical protein